MGAGTTLRVALSVSFASDASAVDVEDADDRRLGALTLDQVRDAISSEPGATAGVPAP